MIILTTCNAGIVLTTTHKIVIFRANGLTLSKISKTVTSCEAQNCSTVFKPNIPLFQGKATDLSSHFKPTYNMILSVLKGKDLKVEELLKRSFAEYEEQVSCLNAYYMESKVHFAPDFHTNCSYA